MTMYVLQLEANKTIKLWDLDKDSAIAQSFDGCNKSRKSKCKIRYYNDKPYVICCGHRYYLDKFTKVEL